MAEPSGDAAYSTARRSASEDVVDQARRIACEGGLQRRGSGGGGGGGGDAAGVAGSDSADAGALRLAEMIQEEAATLDQRKQRRIEELERTTEALCEQYGIRP
eukprot:Rhum_TRINITY_DN6568_c0_g1::Rhum_TRINITY_DN6568_c0_g1_i1::g.20423::m.20423